MPFDSASLALAACSVVNMTDSVFAFLIHLNPVKEFFITFDSASLAQAACSNVNVTVNVSTLPMYVSYLNNPVKDAFWQCISGTGCLLRSECNHECLHFAYICLLP